jgi:hypothetical protein
MHRRGRWRASGRRGIGRHVREGIVKVQQIVDGFHTGDREDAFQKRPQLLFQNGALKFDEALSHLEPNRLGARHQVANARANAQLQHGIRRERGGAKTFQSKKRAALSKQQPIAQMRAPPGALLGIEPIGGGRAGRSAPEKIRYFSYFRFHDSGGAQLDDGF